jgi:hypothetical protein
MATRTKLDEIDTNAEQDSYMDEKVPISLFKDDGKYSDDVSVTVDEVKYLIQRGTTVIVPRKVAVVLAQSDSQDKQTADLITKLESEFVKKSKQL